MKLLKVLTLLLPFLFLGTHAFAEETTPKQVVEATVESIIDVLEERTNKDTMTDHDREGIRKVVAGKFDYADMSRRVVGSKLWREMGAEKQAKFAEIFRQMLEYSYGNQLAGYHGQKVVFKKAKFSKKTGNAKVKGKVIDTDKSIPMEYRLHKTATGWQVHDIKIEGVSMIATFRKDYKSVIKSQGVDGLMVKLQAKVEALKAKG
ncbi:MAG: ABC transporter substrate-binding protein [Ghiorsea sp.]